MWQGLECHMEKQHLRAMEQTLLSHTAAMEMAAAETSRMVLKFRYKIFQQILDILTYLAALIIPSILATFGWRVV
jgi:hypothetical protein